MIFYIPWTNELVVVTFYNNKSLYMNGENFEVGSMARESAEKFGWEYVGDL